MCRYIGLIGSGKTSVINMMRESVEKSDEKDLQSLLFSMELYDRRATVKPDRTVVSAAFPIKLCGLK